MDLAYNITCTMLCISTIICSLELLSLKPFNLAILVQNKKLNYSHLISVKWILYLQIISSILVVLFCLKDFHVYMILGLWIVFLSNLYLYVIKSSGRDGADQLRLITLGILALASLVGKDSFYTYSIIFISIQVIISYITSGISKLNSSYWRKGDALGKILNNYTYGNQYAAILLLNNKGLNRALTYAPIFLMITLPFTFISSEINYLLLSLISLFGFHLGTALLMGLNDFLFTFPATYPCLIAIHITIHN